MQVSTVSTDAGAAGGWKAAGESAPAAAAFGHSLLSILFRSLLPQASAKGGSPLPEDLVGALARSPSDRAREPESAAMNGITTSVATKEAATKYARDASLHAALGAVAVAKAQPRTESGATTALRSAAGSLDAADMPQVSAPQFGAATADAVAGSATKAGECRKAIGEASPGSAPPAAGQKRRPQQEDSLSAAEWLRMGDPGTLPGGKAEAPDVVQSTAMKSGIETATDASVADLSVAEPSVANPGSARMRKAIAVDGLRGGPETQPLPLPGAARDEMESAPMERGANIAGGVGSEARPGAVSALDAGPSSSGGVGPRAAMTAVPDPAALAGEGGDARLVRARRKDGDQEKRGEGERMEAARAPDRLDVMPAKEIEPQTERIAADAAARPLHAGRNPLEQMDQGLPGARILHADVHRLDVGIDDPTHGWMEVHTRLASGQVSATLSSPSAEAQAHLQAHLPQLHAYLEERNLPLTAVSVESGGRGMESDGSRQGRGERQGSEPGGEAPHPARVSSGEEEETRPRSRIDLRA